MPRYIRYTKAVCVLMAVVAVVALIGVTAFAAKAPPRITILLKDTGITATNMRPRGGDYTIVVKNFSSTNRGIAVSGTDKGGSEYIRYSKVVPRGQMDSFGFYFPRGKNVLIRDILSCEKDQRACMRATYGGHKLTLRFR